MVSAFFEHFKSDVSIMITPPPKAMVIEEDEDVGYLLSTDNAPRAVQIEEDEDDLFDPGNPGLVIPRAEMVPDGFIPAQNQVRPLTPTPRAVPNPQDPWTRPGDPPPRRAIEIEEESEFEQPRQPARAIPIEEE